MTSRIYTVNKWKDRTFRIAALLSTIIGLIVLAVLLIDILHDGLKRIDLRFLTSFPSRKPERAGILSPLVGTLWVMILTAIFAFPIGVGAGIYLEEYAKRNWFTRLIEINIANLAGVPSIIYGLLGLGIFVRALAFDRSILTGSLTLTLLVLPIIIIATRESLRTIPLSIREASYALGATRWQTVSRQVLPAALPGILTGTILALSRAIGETAPLITIGALTYIAFLPTPPVRVVDTFPFIDLSLQGLFDPFTVLPIQIFNWVSRPQAGFFTNAAAAIIVLLVVTLILNSIAIFLRYRFQRRIRW